MIEVESNSDSSLLGVSLMVCLPSGFLKNDQTAILFDSGAPGAPVTDS